MTHWISLEREAFAFSAAHFTTFGEDCEPLHGHNYRISVEIAGDLTSDSWVLDFREAKQFIDAVCRQLDHKFLLPVTSRALDIEESGREYVVRFHDRRYVMPASDVAALPIDNSTAERLAEWIADRIVAELHSRGVENLRRLRVRVEEAPGQAAWYETAFPAERAPEAG
jgi:6-pyruvoyltetrahydropterin/6-carboxytetrahydropterin synthase